MSGRHGRMGFWTERLESRRLLAFTTLSATPVTLSGDVVVGTGIDGDGTYLTYVANSQIGIRLPSAFNRLNINYSTTFNDSGNHFYTSEDISQRSSYCVVRDSNANGVFDTTDVKVTPFTKASTTVELAGGNYFIYYTSNLSVAAADRGKLTDVTANATGWFDTSATPLNPPEIAVTQVLDNDTTPSAAESTDFGTVAVGSAIVQRSYTVKNTGGAALALGSPTLPSGFAVIKGLPASLAAGASATLTIGMSTTAAGTKSGTLSFTTNDADENPYNFAIKGVVGSASTFAKIVSGELQITGTAGKDTIDVKLSGSNVLATLNGASMSFTFASVTQIKVDALADADRITVDTLITKKTRLLGGTGNDSIRGSGGADSIDGGDGNDSIVAAAGNDLILGGIGDDYLQDDNGNDTTSGGSGNDTLTGFEGNDSLSGNTGNDTYLWGAPGAAQTDTIVELASEGTDTISFSLSSVAVTIDMTNAAALAKQGTLRTVKIASTQILNLENAIGGAAADVIVGNSRANTLTGGKGIDVLIGGDGADTLFGGDDADKLYGYTKSSNTDADRDSLVGGLGTDTFYKETIDIAVQ